MKRLFLIIILLVSSCGPQSLQDYREEGRARSKLLIATLKKIESAEQLETAAPHLKKQFMQIVDLMIAADSYQSTHRDTEQLELQHVDEEINQNLKFELRRICAMEGCRKQLEKIQEPALFKLDSYEHKKKL